MTTIASISATELRNIEIAESAAAAHIVIGSGKAGTWSNDASAVERQDADLRATAKARGLYDLAQKRGACDKDGNLLGEGWLLVVGAHVQHSDLDSDTSVIAYCDAD